MNYVYEEEIFELFVDKVNLLELFQCRVSQQSEHVEKEEHGAVAQEQVGGGGDLVAPKINATSTVGDSEGTETQEADLQSFANRKIRVPIINN